jgi:fatty acid desaturase
MNNLEEISYDSVLHARFGSYAEWRKTLKPDYTIVWRDIILGYLALLAILFISTIIAPSGIFLFILTILITSILTGLILAYLALFLHEAGHFNLHADKKKNDRLARIFLGIPFGTDIRSYRKIHWQHHLHLGATSDTETSYFNALTPQFLVESFTGIHLLKVLRKKNSHDVLNTELKKESRKMLLAGAFFNLLVISICLVAGAWGTAIAWALGMLVFFPFFATLRQILEHRHEFAGRGTDYTKTAHGKYSRLFGSSAFSRVFGAAGFNRHMIHHWDPQASYTRYADIENFLSCSDATKEIVAGSKTTYWKTLRKLLSQK